MKNVLLLICLLVAGATFAQEKGWQGKFEQLDQMLPTPNEIRSASGAPGPKYWQQQADYVINAELNDVNQSITGSETITYTNNSPDPLKYLWVQLDQNINERDNNTQKTSTNSVTSNINTKTIAGNAGLYDFDGGFKIKKVADASGKALPYFINQTMMRVDLPQPLTTGQKVSFSIDWSFNINDRVRGATPNDGRSGMEYFPKDGNYLYIIAQWFPRMCVYDDLVGWQNKQFLGQGEFTLSFGNYQVNLTVPADHVVAGTGMVQNLKEVLTPDQYSRFEKAKTSFDKPVIICNQQEAMQREQKKSTQKKTWKFKADNVRDFAFATSRKFIWDAQAVKIADKTVLGMSYYPKEGNPLWEKESTQAVKNTILGYSRFSINYPYPQATSVHAASLGMEYPMICFNHGRPKEDGTYTDQLKWGMIGVIVHEVGHNFFPMIINSDERQTTWMDEGLNTFVQHLTQTIYYPDMPARRGPAAMIVPYMKSDPTLQRPLMVNSETVVRSNFGNEQYAKCATALNILRETVMGPELFDKSFKEYCERWAFKHPKPGDLFRTLEDASAVDLDWFWRGWFFTTDNNNQSIEKVKWFKTSTETKNIENKNITAKEGDLSASGTGNLDFSAGPQPLTVANTPETAYGDFKSRVDDKAILAKLDGKNIYEVTFANKGGLVMPVIIEWTYKDGTKEIEKIPAEIWRLNEQVATKTFVKDKEVVNIVLDPKGETADVSLQDNVFPRKDEPSQFDKFKKTGGN
ncbi:MAG TPA: M1 family metallopeptidase [Cyclobacteriaceae bacterium]|nr:M1 family metallopeptidase [Cyclobacteriaceae bacterium]HMV07689.1 M1 family metallopeptidase [Cyclobacteriaceae bacterium]HMV88490.1 M1 family metallopeptidase [Cyclobacteriaceae bacterium]HMW98824.1 M1 family metallopeptidase [Cyclobacteriaceae bacterium]HMX48543.1 M1 family metallopeptidase [Cyclobacteriaceae bacterium]